MTKATVTPIPANADPVKRATAIVALRDKSDRYNSAYIAGIAHELALRFNGKSFEKGAQSALVESLGYDKGNMSRIAAIVKSDAKARGAALKVKVLDIDSTPETLAAAVKVGLMFRRVKSATEPTEPTGEGEETTGGVQNDPTESTDVLVTVQAWLRAAEGDAFAQRLAHLQDAIETVMAERAAEEAAA